MLFSRRYPTVERRARTRTAQYYPLPSDPEWLEAVLIECGEAHRGDEVVSIVCRLWQLLACCILCPLPVLCLCLFAQGKYGI